MLGVAMISLRVSGISDCYKASSILPSLLNIFNLLPCALSFQPQPNRMWFFPAYLAVLVGAAIWPTYAAPLEADADAVRYNEVYARIHGRGNPSSIVSALISPTTSSSPNGSPSTSPSSTITTASTSTKASANPSESIILAIQGDNEWLANGKTKWLTYFVSGGEDPDWCDGANAKKTLSSGDDANSLPSIDYDTDSGDAFLNGCAYNSSEDKFTCGDWSATCTDIMGQDDLGFTAFGKDVGTCDDLPVKELVVCKQDGDSPALPTSATGTSTSTASATTTTGVTEPEYTAACTQGMRNASTWIDYEMAEFLRDE